MDCVAGDHISDSLSHHLWTWYFSLASFSHYLYLVFLQKLLLPSDVSLSVILLVMSSNFSQGNLHQP